MIGYRRCRPFLADYRLSIKQLRLRNLLAFQT